MKNLSWLIFVVFSLFFFASCGGNENETANEEEGDNVAVSLKVARDGGCTGMQLECLGQDLAAISFQIRNGKGETVFQQSVSRNELRDMKLTGIKNAENATLIVSVFLGTDMNTPKWQGKASGLKFESGETTHVEILLYPKDVQKTELNMPERLDTPRFGHTSTVLIDGRVLVAGGFTECYSNGKCSATKSVEIIDMESGKVEKLTDMAEERAMHTAIALNDGSVLFIGGVHSLETDFQGEAFENYPPMKYSPSNVSVKIEQYMPKYPKYNMGLNNLGTPISNITVPLTPVMDIPFAPFQSILAKRISDTQTDVFLVGGLDENGAPSKKSYKFTVTETDENTLIGSVTELAESSEPMLLPALAYSNGSILAVGGRPTASQHAASIISETGSEDFGEAKDNIFFTQGIDLNGNFFTFGGYEVDQATNSLISSAVKYDEDGNEQKETRLNRNRKWNVSGKSVQQFDTQLRTYNANVTFPYALHDSENNRFIIIGGTDAADIYQVINSDSLIPYDQPITHIMSDKRIMSSAAVVPAGVIGDTPIIVITGGTSAFDGTGKIAPEIKINNL